MLKKKRKRILLGVLAVLCMTLIIFYSVDYFGAFKSNQENQSPDDSSEAQPKPQLAIPEVPLGILGSIGALAAGFGMLAIRKKRK